MKWRGTGALLLVAAVALLAAQGARGQDVTGYCAGDGGPLGMATDTEHTVKLGEAPLPSGLRSERVTVDGVATRVVESGPRTGADAVVFIHGNPGSARDFDPLLQMSGRFARSVAIDMPGYGQSDKGAAQVQSTDGAAGFIGGVLGQLGIQHAVLVLHDFGGPWGLQWAAKNPDLLTGAVLIDTGVLIDYVPHPFAVVWATPEAGELDMATTTRDSFITTIQSSQPQPLPDDFMQRMYDNYDRAERCAALRYYRSAGSDLNLGREQAAVLSQKSRPALVIWGGGDVFVPPSHAEDQKQAFPDAQIHILDGSGHWPFVDDLYRTRLLMLPFLRPKLVVTRPHARAGARRVRVHVDEQGMLPAYRVRAVIRSKRSSRPRTLRGPGDLVIKLRKPLRRRGYTIRVAARGIPTQFVRFRTKPRPTPR